MIGFVGVRLVGRGRRAVVLALLLVWVALATFLPELPGMRDPWLEAAALPAWSAWGLLRLSWWIVVFAVLRGGGLAPADVGWQRGALLRAVVAAVGLCGLGWLVMQGLEHWFLPSSHRDVFAVRAGVVLGELLGVALVEETICRGFLLLQLVVGAERRGVAPAAARLLALAWSTAFFVLCHVPALVAGGAGGAEAAPDWLRTVAVGGVLLGWVFLRTGNLWWCVVAHTFVNVADLAMAGSWFRGWPVAPCLVVVVTWLGWRWLQPPTALSDLPSAASLRSD